MSYYENPAKLECRLLSAQRDVSAVEIFAGDLFYASFQPEPLCLLLHCNDVIAKEQ